MSTSVSPIYPWLPSQVQTFLKLLDGNVCWFGGCMTTLKNSSERQIDEILRKREYYL